MRSREEQTCGECGEQPLGCLAWVIAGGESGPRARPMYQHWARSLRDQCQAAGVAFFFKQWGEWMPLMDAHNQGVHYSLSQVAYGMVRVGKRTAGAVLDGREHKEFPDGR